MTNFVPGWWYSTSGFYQLSNHASNSVKVFLHSFAGVKEEETNLFVHRAAIKGRHASRDASLFTFIYRSHLLTDIFTYSLFNGDLVLKIGKVSSLLWSRFLRDKTSNIKKNRSATFLFQLNNEKKAYLMQMHVSTNGFHTYISKRSLRPSKAPSCMWVIMLLFKRLRMKKEYIFSSSLNFQRFNVKN